jgi:hypothetical protein
MLGQREAKTMVRVLASGKRRFALTAAFLNILEVGIGTKRGASVYYTEDDLREMRDWLIAKGYGTEPKDLSALSRSASLAYTPNEKAGAAAVKKNRVSVKALAGQRLLVAGTSLELPAGSHLDIDWNQISNGLGHKCILVVENYESFDQIHRTDLQLPPKHDAPLVIYHGDPQESRLDNVMAFLSSIRLPVLAFMDADPAGIAMASRLPGIAGVVLPPQDDLEAQLRSPAMRRTDLYTNQLPIHQATLRALPLGHPCYGAWRLVERHRAGIVQERWIGSQRCTVLTA